MRICTPARCEAGTVRCVAMQASARQGVVALGTLPECSPSAPQTTPARITQPLLQLAVYGKESMRRMATCNVLICGLGGLGVEVGEWAGRLLAKARRLPAEA